MVTCLIHSNDCATFPDFSPTALQAIGHGRMEELGGELEGKREELYLAWYWKLILV